jgi:hypothetical protein
MEQNKVFIIADDNGNVIQKYSSNPEFGYVKLQQVREIFIADGCLHKTTLSNTLSAKFEDFKSLGLENFKTLPGKILIIESLEPFRKTNPERDYKYAGETGIVCCQNGLPIYRKTVYVNDVTADDVLLEVNNISEIELKINEHFMQLNLSGNFQLLLNETLQLLKLNVKSQLIFFYAGLAAQEMQVNSAKFLYKGALNSSDGIELYGGGPTRLFTLNNLSNLLFDLEEYQECKSNCQEFIRVSELFNNPASINNYIVNNHYLFATSVFNLYRNFDVYADASMLGLLKRSKAVNELMSAKKAIITAIELTPITKGNDYFLSDYNDVLNKLNKLIINLS